MATRKLTPKRIQSAIFDQCQEALVGAQVNIMDLGKVMEAAEQRYHNLARTLPAATHEECLKVARKAADEKVAELRTDKRD